MKLINKKNSFIYLALTKKSQKSSINEANEQAKCAESTKKSTNRGVLSDKSPNTLHKPRQRSVSYY
jgi:hypothetical protein